MFSQQRREQLSSLENSLGYRFKDLKLLNKALTHKSYVNENNEDLKHNERFEFLGDSVLDLIVSDYMVRTYANYWEGALSKIRAAVVNETCLAALARALDLGEYLLLGKGESQSGGRSKNSLLANAYEAVVGAIYFDSDLEETSRTLLPFLIREISKYDNNQKFRDYKSELQEFTQNRLVCIPTYRVTNETGPDHEKRFEVNVLIQDEALGKGAGRSKKEAEQAAAQQALETLHMNLDKSLPDAS